MGNISGLLATQDSSDIPVMASGVVASSGIVANAQAQATLAAKTGQTAYLTGIQVTAAGATAASTVTLSVTGLQGGTMSYVFNFPVGVNVAALNLLETFYPALQASGPGVAIVATLPAGGAGNTAASVNLQGFYL
jgi:hypothetical protein